MHNIKKKKDNSSLLICFMPRDIANNVKTSIIKDPKFVPGKKLYTDRHGRMAITMEIEYVNNEEFIKITSQNYKFN